MNAAAMLVRGNEKFPTLEYARTVSSRPPDGRHRVIRVRVWLGLGFG